MGAYNVAYGNRSNVIGTYSRAMGSNSVAIGSGVQSLSDDAIAIGKGSGYEFEDASRSAKRNDNDENYYGRDWKLPPEYQVLKQVLRTDITGDEIDTRTDNRKKSVYFKNKQQPKYNNYGAGSSDPGGFIVEGQNALGIGTYTLVRGDSAIGLATGEMTADLSDKDKSAYARDMRKIMDMEETLYDAKEALKSGSTSDKATLEANVKTAEESLAAAKKEFRKNYLSKYSFVEGEGALGVGRQILAQGNRSMAVGDYAKAISNDAIAYGGQTLANGTNSMAMGGNAHVGTIDTSFDNSMAIGSHTNVQAGNAVALGAFSQVTGTNSLALGFGTQSSTDSNNITYNSVSGHDSTLIGSYGNIAGNNSILIGSSGSIANDRVVGLGNNINIEAADQNDQENNTAGSVFLGDHAGYVKDSKRARSLGEVTLVGSDKKKELTESLSSTKGALRDYTKDFIYIYMLENQDDGTQIGAPIAVRSDFAGGDSTVGVVSVGSTYEQKFKDLTAIKDYHTKVGSLITVPVEVEVEVTKNGIKLGKQNQTRYFAADSTEEAINADNTLSEADKKKVWDAIKAKTSSSDSTYTVFETRRIQNVAPGLIGVNSTDAINGSQLFATNQMLGNLVGSLKKTFGDNVTITEDGQIKVSGGTLGWIAKAKAADGSNGTVNYQVGKDDKITKDDLEKKGSAIEAADQLVFQAGKNIGLVQTPDTLTISTIDTPSFKSVELRGDEKTVDGKKVTEVTKIDSSGMKVVTETSTPASDGSTTPPTVTEKVSTTVGKDGVSTDGSVKVTNGKDGDKDLVSLGKGKATTGETDQDFGTIHIDGKQGADGTITIDRGTKSITDEANVGEDPSQPVSDTNKSAKMDRITYTTKNKDGNDVITHEVATMDDGLFFSGDSADGKNGNVKNTFGRKLSEEAKIVGGVDLGLTDSASAKERQEAIAAKLTDGNIGVISDGTDTLTVKLAKQLTGLDSTTYTSPTTKTDDGEATSTMKVDGNGIRFVGDNNAVKTDAPSLTTDGITGGNKQITNVGSGFKNGTTSVTIDDIKNPSDALKNSNVWNNAVNVGDLKNIIDTGFKLNTSGQPTKPGASTVKIGDTINIIDGANTKVSAIDDSTTGTHTFHIDVNGLPMSYVDSDGNPLTKIGDKFYKTSDLVNGEPPAGTAEVPANKVTSNVSMLDNTGSHTGVAPQIKNIGSGLVDNNGKTIKPNELLNMTDANNPVLKNAVNVGDLKQVVAAAKTEVTGTGEAFVTDTEAEDGHIIYNVHVDKLMTVKPVDPTANITRGGDGKYYNKDDIAGKTFVSNGNGGGSWYNASDVDAKTGKPLEGKTPLADQPIALGQSKLKNSVVNPNGDGATIVDNVKSGIGGDAGNGIKDGTTVDGTQGNNTFIKNLDKVGGTGEGAIDKTTVVNAGDLKNLADTPLFFSGDSADGVAAADGTDKNTFARKLSQETKIVGGVTTPANLTDNNIGVVSNGSDTLTIKLAKQLTGLDSATYTSPTTKTDDGEATSTMKVDGNGIRFVGDNNAVKTDAPSLTTDGITGGNKQITNVGSGLKDGDTTISISDLDDSEKWPNTNSIWNNAVNVGDLKKAKDAATTEVTGTGKAIVTKTVGNKGQNIYNVHVDPVVDVVATDGKTPVVRGDDGKYYKPSDIANKTYIPNADGNGGNWYDNGDLTNGVPNQGAKPQNVTPTDVKNNFVNPNGTGSIVLDNVKSGIGGEVEDADGNNTFIDNINKVGKKSDDGTEAPDAISENTVVNAKDLKNVVDTGFKLNTSGHNGDAQTVKIGETIKVVDGANTKVSDITPKDGVHEFHIDVTGLPMTYTVSQTGDAGTSESVSKVGDTYQLADGTKLVKVGDKYYTPDQLDNGQPKPNAEGLTIKQSVSLVQDNGAPATLERVGSGRRNGMDATADPMAWDKILNPSAADKAKVDDMLTNAANIGDVRDAIKSITNGTDDNAIGGFGLTGNNGEVKQDLGKTITVKGGIANKKDDSGKDLPAKSTTAQNTYVNVKDSEMVVEIAKDLTDLDSVTVGSVDPTTGKGETTKITGKDVTIKDKAGNTNTSTATKDELTNANGDKTTVEAGKVDVSKKNADGTTSNTNIDGSKITLENKDKDSNTVGSKTDIGTDGIRITYKDDKGKTDPKKDVSLTDKGLNNGGNQIKNVGSGLVDKNGKDITDISNITDSDILSNGVNVGDLKQAINSVTNSSNGGGFGLTGNNGKIMQNLGETITIKGGIANKKDDSGEDLGQPTKSTTAQNTYVNVKDSEMVVEIAKDLTDLDSVTVGSDKDGKGETTKITGKDVTIKDKDGKNSTNIGTGTIGTSKTDGNGNTSSTNINGSHMTLENKDKNGKLTGPKTEVSNKGITITPVDKDGNPIEGKKVELSDTGLDNGGNQIKHVDSGLKKENGDSVKLEDATGDMLNNAVNVGDLQSVNAKLKDDIINISNQVDDIKNSAPVVYTDENGKRVSKQGDKFVDEDGIEVKPHKIKLRLVNADGKTTNPSTLQNVAKGVNKTDAVNVEQLTDATEKPLTFNGDAGSSSAKLGETVAIKGGANSADLTDNNIGVIADSTTKTLNVKLSKKLKGLESAEFVDNNGNTTNITGDGVHISGGNGSNVSLTSQGLNNGGNRITNVAPGVEATDAVNVSQLNQVGAALHNRINNVAKGAYGGVASAGAMASLPQAYLPGKSMVAAGASHYRGESAVALGTSRISDNGKIILKLNASHNTSGNTMVGAGVGYQF
ncbi:YadA-like family protein [Gallibacterium anatis]|uniref:YadA-like family protein n=1 Tax=Gallibacterium anatis TaxID=750 RepID=UPI0018AFB7C9|nr:YadA-like family protein [Gallibacterium anatis]